MPASTSGTPPVVFRWPRAQALRVAGLVVSLVGLLWLAAVGVEAVAQAAGGLVLAAGLVAVAGLMGAVLVVLRPPKVLTLTSDGYVVHHLRGAGVTTADWSQVVEVSTEAVDDGDALVISLPGHRHTVVPMALLGPRAGEARRRIRELLNGAHGYRRLTA